ncbi:hypothetical protein SH661x_001691 [Planctomicrobium sp. SH661]|uniref:hypothetical protein n=1 Tax=Planctomicrobium sp. SH661 TaxID=3448124 RepID=UPI003F5C273C
MTLVAIWITAAYFRERLLLSRTAIIQHGVFRSKQIAFTDVKQVHWRCWPVGGSVIIQSESARITIELEGFSREERETLINRLRNLFHVDIQQGWSPFEAKLHSPHQRTALMSRAGSLATALVLMCFACGFAFFGFKGFGKEYLVIGLINVIAAGWCLSRIPKIKKASGSENHLE